MRAGARPAAARLPQRRTPTATGRSGSCSSSASATSAPATRTATSCSGRCWRWRSTCSPPTTRRSSTRSCPFFHAEGDERAEHGDAARATSSARSALIARRVIPGTQLAAYGHGDWNDSLQPADPAMRERLCSAWTVTLHHQTLATLAAALRASGRGGRGRARGAAARASATTSSACSSRTASSPGFAYFARRRARRATCCTRATASTGIRYSLLPMIHAILADLLHAASRRERHVDADPRAPARAPTARASSTGRCRTAAGSQRYFQRAETSTFFGREIGLMYTHAHLRYAEAMAHFGDAEALLPRAAAGQPRRPARRWCRTRGCARPTATRRAPTPAFAGPLRGRGALRRGADRARCRSEGGWRVYSSGAGHRAAPGPRVPARPAPRARASSASIPVLPRALDGLRARSSSPGRAVELALPRRQRAAAGRRRCALNGAAAALRARGESLPRGRRARGDGRAARAAARRRATRSWSELG